MELRPTLLACVDVLSGATLGFVIAMCRALLSVVARWQLYWMDSATGLRCAPLEAASDVLCCSTKIDVARRRRAWVVESSALQSDMICAKLVTQQETSCTMRISRAWRRLCTWRIWSHSSRSASDPSVGS
mmetsp:Transcript_27940/g.47190  ORF Transcript_27940/g.47190 Transcript_27940/m.47190 type:complete len:130 (+) Transcript_27940:127-516(+)